MQKKKPWKSKKMKRFEKKTMNMEDTTLLESYRHLGVPWKILDSIIRAFFFPPVTIGSL